MFRLGVSRIGGDATNTEWTKFLRFLADRCGAQYDLTEWDPLASADADRGTAAARASQYDLLLFLVGPAWTNLTDKAAARARSVVQAEYAAAKQSSLVWVFAIGDLAIPMMAGLDLVRHDMAILNGSTAEKLAEHLCTFCARRFQAEVHLFEARELMRKAEFWLALSAVERALSADSRHQGARKLQQELEQAGYFRIHRGEMGIESEPEDVQFSVVPPAKLGSVTPERLLAYVHLPEVVNQIDEDVRIRMSGEGTHEHVRVSSPGRTQIRRGTTIQVVPSLEGCIVTPENAHVSWIRDWECVEFQCQLERGSPTGTLAGTVSFFVGPLLIAEVPFTTVRADVEVRGANAVSNRFSAGLYNAVFVSYAHEDADIVVRLEPVYEALGLEYLYDVKFLRSGEKWGKALLARIEYADVFQLLWSRAARHSAHVEDEWRHALGLRRRNFIRPVYWRKPLPTPPAELADLHFAYLPLDRTSEAER